MFSVACLACVCNSPGEEIGEYRPWGPGEPNGIRQENCVETRMVVGTSHKPARDQNGGRCVTHKPTRDQNGGRYVTQTCKRPEANFSKTK